MRMRSYLPLLLPALMAGAGCSAPLAETPQENERVTSDAVMVYYFHRTVRCPACEKIERLAHQALEEEFVREMSEGHLVWQPVNLDEPEHAHLSNHYQLQFQSVVVSEMRGGREASWKNLKKVWDLLDDDEAMRFYVRDEVRASLENQKEQIGS